MMYTYKLSKYYMRLGITLHVPIMVSFYVSFSFHFVSHTGVFSFARRECSFTWEDLLCRGDLF